ncbi:hypothetical protein Saa2_05065 [Streptomyces acidiscabies]|nr:hypothetical protein Saa2_05065 [Streptomyces acidiscabies]
MEEGTGGVLRVADSDDTWDVPSDFHALLVSFTTAVAGLHELESGHARYISFMIPSISLTEVS